MNDLQVNYGSYSTLKSQKGCSDLFTSLWQKKKKKVIYV